MRANATLMGSPVLAADEVSSLTGLTSGKEDAMGAFFVLYGLVVFSHTALPNLWCAGIGVVVADIGYILATTVAAETVPMTSIGVAVVLFSGAYTAAFAALQYLGVRRLGT
ncbi:hypothetical protein MUBE_13855 [Mycobacterium uberis]|uniref:Uncharacterized protein n=2 Tax=Mycobacterium uberis TaxID=2162698 RepID=A0A3E1HDL3_9MYCO|nr:hypothetical protein [Mycobacterium uberis]RFD24344.1 hypothetical protein MUBE_13855 [Mycobacterium uberis]